MDQFEVVVSKAEALTPRIREFVLARANGAPMPGWAAGAHIDVHLPDVPLHLNAAPCHRDDCRRRAPDARRVVQQLKCLGPGGSADRAGRVRVPAGRQAQECAYLVTGDRQPGRRWPGHHVRHRM